MQHANDASQAPGPDDASTEVLMVDLHDGQSMRIGSGPKLGNCTTTVTEGENIEQYQNGLDFRDPCQERVREFTQECPI